VDADRLRGILYFSPQSLSFPGVVFALAGGALFGAFWGSLGWIEANDLKGRLDRGEAMAIIDMPGGGDRRIHWTARTHCNLAQYSHCRAQSRFAELGGLEHTPIILVCRTEKTVGNCCAGLACGRFHPHQHHTRGLGALEHGLVCLSVPIRTILVASCVPIMFHNTETYWGMRCNRRRAWHSVSRRYGGLQWPCFAQPSRHKSRRAQLDQAPHTMRSVARRLPTAAGLQSHSGRALAEQALSRRGLTRCLYSRPTSRATHVACIAFAKRTRDCLKRAVMLVDQARRNSNDNET
jgi:hypothetical protein